MPVLTTLTLSSLTLAYLMDCIISNAVGNSPRVVYKTIPKWAQRLRKRLRDTKPEVNGHLQKAILSAHWMATTVFVEQMHKTNLLKAAYTNVNQTVKGELKRLADEEYHPEEISPEVYDVTKLIKLPKEKEMVEELESQILEFHFKLLDKKTGDVKNLEDYKKLKKLIRNGWKEENLDWFQLMTAFLNQLLKGDNNKAKDFFQNHTLAEVKLKLDHFENFAKGCKKGIGEERFKEFETDLKEDIDDIKTSVTRIEEGIERIEVKQDSSFNELVKLREDVLALKNEKGESKELNLNVFQKYKSLSSEIDSLKIEIEELENEKDETLEFIKTEENEKKRNWFEKDFAKADVQQIRKRFEREQKEAQIKEFEANIEKTWLSVYAENSPRLSEARIALEIGDLEKANLILDDDELQIAYEKGIKAKRLLKKASEVINEGLTTQAQEFITKANLILTLKERPDWFLLADKYFSQAVELHESYETSFTYANFLSSHGEPDQAYTFLEKALNHATKPFDKANTINSLGGIYRANNDNLNAGIKFIEALEIYEELAVDWPKYQFEIAGASQNLGRVYGQIGQPDKAELLFNRAIEIYQGLIKVGLIIYQYNLAVCLNNLGILYLNQGLQLQDKRIINLAEERFKEALEINRKLAKSGKERDIAHLAKTLNNLGVLNFGQKRNEIAVEIHTEALGIRLKLASVNPKAHNSYLADTLYNLANAQIDLTEAEKNLKKSLEIYKLNLNESSQSHLLGLAKVALELATFYKERKKDKGLSIEFADLAIIHFTPFSHKSNEALKGKALAEQFIKEWK